MAGEDISILMGDLSLKTVLKSPPPVVKARLKTQDPNAYEVIVDYEVSVYEGDIGEISVYQNGKLIYTDGQYKTSLTNEVYLAPDADKKAVDLVIEERYRRISRLDSEQKSVKLTRYGKAKNCNPCNETIRIKPVHGEDNEIIIIAKNSQGTIASIPTIVHFKSTLTKQKQKLWVLAIGINIFEDIPDLFNARKDAEDFIHGFQNKSLSLFDPGDIHLKMLLDTKATKQNILDSLKDIAQQAQPGDTFVWFVSSHGLMDANSLYAIAPTDLKCISGTIKNCLQFSGLINSNEILEASRKISAMKQLLILDTCHAGGLNMYLSGLYDARISVLAKMMGLHIYASAAATELASDGEWKGNGLFTKSLLNSLNHNARDDNQ